MMSPEMYNQCTLNENKVLSKNDEQDSTPSTKQQQLNSPNLSEGIQEHQSSESTTPEQFVKNKIFSIHEQIGNHDLREEQKQKIDSSLSLRIFNPLALKSILDQEHNKCNPALFQDFGKEAQSIVIEDEEQQQSVEQNQQQIQQNDLKYLTYEQQEIIKKIIKKSKNLCSLNICRLFQLIIVVSYSILKLVWLLYIFEVLKQVKGTASNHNIKVLDTSDSSDNMIIYISCIILAFQIISMGLSEISIILNLRGFKRYKRYQIIGLELSLICEVIFFALNQSYQIGIDSIFKLVAIILLAATLIVQSYSLQVYMNLLKKVRYCLYGLKIDPYNLPFTL